MGAHQQLRRLMNVVIHYNCKTTDLIHETRYHRNKVLNVSLGSEAQEDIIRVHYARRNKSPMTIQMYNVRFMRKFRF